MDEREPTLAEEAWEEVGARLAAGQRPGDPEWERQEGVPWALLEYGREPGAGLAEAALRELYEATHDYLNATDARGRMRAGTPRLNTALKEAFAALHDTPSQ